MFNSLSFSELITILLVVVIVFGPNRLPEMARKLGQWTAKARQSVDNLKEELGTEYQDVVAPLKDARDDLKGIKRELGDAARAVMSDADEAARGVERSAKDATGFRRGLTKEGAGSGTGASEAEQPPPPEEDRPEPASADEEATS